jgi:polyisoprenoid-binding protein YceI
MSTAATAVSARAERPGLPVGDWDLDVAHTSIGFVARHMRVAKSRGQFSAFTATVHVDDEPGRSWAEATIEAASIDTRHEQRDGHLRSPDFLDVERFPTLRFRSTSFEHLGGPHWRVVGDLTIRDVTRPIELRVEFGGTAKNPWGAEVAFFIAEGELDREAYGMTWNQALEGGGFLVSKKVQIEIEGEAIRR